MLLSLRLEIEIYTGIYVIAAESDVFTYIHLTVWDYFPVTLREYDAILGI